MIFSADKIRGKWGVTDNDTNVRYFPPKGVKGKQWAIKRARELNNIRHNKYIAEIVTRERN